MNKAVILDRDGTINIEKNYLSKVEEFEFIENVPEAIKKLNHLGYKIVVISNQSGIGRGYFTELDVKKINEYMIQKLKEKGATIDAIYYCPHSPDNDQEECNCRKPKLGLYEKAIKEWNIDVSETWAVGDKITDLIGPNKLGMKTALVLTGYGQKEAENKQYTNIYKNLYDFAIEIENKIRRKDR